MTLIFKYLKQIWLPMILLLALTVIATFTATSRPLAIAGVIDLTLDRLEMSDRLNKSYDSNVSDANLFDLNQSGSIISDFILSFINIEKGVNDFVPHFIAIILFLSILTGIIQYTASALNSFLRSDVIRKIRTDFVDSLLGLGLSFFNRIRSGDLIARTIEESRAAGLGIVSVSHRILHSALLIGVYFIFLVNTSSLDSDSERKVQKGIEKALFSRTAIIVAHRLSTIQYADKIVVLEKGKIQAIGNHNDLIENSPTYSSLYSEL